MQLQREHWQFCKFVACKNLYYWVNGKSEIKPLHFHDNLQLILLISSYRPLECVFILVSWYSVSDHREGKGKSSQPAIVLPQKNLKRVPNNCQNKQL